MPTILVVQNDEALRDVLADALSDEGYQVLPVADGARALEILREQPVDLIIVDRFTVTMSGRAFLDRYRSLPGPHAPTIGVAFGADAFGTDALIPEPFDLWSFLDLIRRLAPGTGPD